MVERGYRKKQSDVMWWLDVEMVQPEGEPSQ
jgi:hypothetical protein